MNGWLFQTPSCIGHKIFGVSSCRDDANAWRDFYFLNCNKKFCVLSASLVDFLHALASSQRPNSSQLPSVCELRWDYFFRNFPTYCILADKIEQLKSVFFCMKISEPTTSHLLLFPGLSQWKISVCSLYSSSIWCYVTLFILYWQYLYFISQSNYPILFKFCNLNLRQHSSVEFGS